MRRDPLGFGTVEHSNEPETADRNAAEGGSLPLLPTMADLDRLAADLDRVDATLVALDREVTGSLARASSPDLTTGSPS